MPDLPGEAQERGVDLFPRHREHLRLLLVRAREGIDPEGARRELELIRLHALVLADEAAMARDEVERMVSPA